MANILILSGIITIVSLCATLTNSQSTTFDIINVHDFDNDAEFYRYVDNQFTVATTRGRERLLDFYNWVRAARQELERKLETWPTFPKSREVLRLKTREKWMRLHQYEISAQKLIRKTD